MCHCYTPVSLKSKSNAESFGVGSTGYLGRFVVQQFKEQGYWIRSLARNPKKLEEHGLFLEPVVKDRIDEIFVGETTKPEILIGVCDGIDIVFSSIGITIYEEIMSMIQ